MLYEKSRKFWRQLFRINRPLVLLLACERVMCIGRERKRRVRWVGRWILLNSFRPAKFCNRTVVADGMEQNGVYVHAGKRASTVIQVCWHRAQPHSSQCLYKGKNKIKKEKQRKSRNSANQWDAVEYKSFYPSLIVITLAFFSSCFGIWLPTVCWFVGPIYGCLIAPNTYLQI